MRASRTSSCKQELPLSMPADSQSAEATEESYYMPPCATHCACSILCCASINLVYGYIALHYSTSKP